MEHSIRIPLLCLTLVSFSLAASAQEGATPAASPAPVAVTDAAATGTAAATPAVAPTPEPPKIPADVYWVSRRVSVPIEGGLLGLEAGTEVRVIKQDGPKWMASTEKGIFEIDSYILIKDAAAAAALRAAAAESSASARAAAARAAAIAEAAEMQRRHEQQKNAAQQTLPGRAPISGASRLNEPAKRQ